MLPNFLVVGAAKAGTTSIFHYLRQHQQIFIPNRKECRFLSRMPKNYRGPGDHVVNDSIIEKIDKYKEIFNGGKQFIARGDISPDYLYYYQNTIRNIKKYFNNDIKILMVLRDPTERAYSQYLYFLSQGREYLPFKEALSQEEWRKKHNWEWAWRYKDVGFYYSQVKSFLKAFGNDMVRVYLFEHLVGDTLSLVQKIYQFIGVDETFMPEIRRYNVSEIPKSKSLNRFLTKPSPITTLFKYITPSTLRKKMVLKVLKMNLEKPAMLPETRKKLIEVYRDDIKRLEELIDVNLSSWLT